MIGAGCSGRDAPSCADPGPSGAESVDVEISLAESFVNPAVDGEDLSTIFVSGTARFEGAACATPPCDLTVARLRVESRDHVETERWTIEGLTICNASSPSAELTDAGTFALLPGDLEARVVLGDTVRRFINTSPASFRLELDTGLFTGNLTLADGRGTTLGVTLVGSTAP